MKTTRMEIAQPAIAVRAIRPQVYVACCFLFCTIATGMAIGHSAVLLPNLQLQNSTIVLDEEMGSWIASLYSIVGPLGAALGGCAIDIYGRRKVVITAGSCLVLGWLLITTAQNGTMILIGRILEGLARSIGGTGNTVLGDELSDPRFRGLIVCTLLTGITTGVFAMSTFGAFLNWRIASGLATLLGFITFLMYCFIYESPTWLVRKDRLKEAEDVLIQLWGPGREKQAKEELKDLIKRLRGEESSSTTRQKIITMVKYLFKPFVLKPFLIMLFFNAIQAFCGLNLFTFYAVDMLSKTRRHGIEVLDDYYTNILVSSLRTITIITTCFLIFSIGRRQLALASGISSFIPALIIGFILIPSNSGSIPASIEIYILFILIIIYAIGMTFGFYALTGIMIGETQPSKIRGFACGFIYAMNDLVLGSILKLYPWLISTLEIHGMFLMFGVSCALCTVFVYFFLPETQGLTLLEIEDYFKQPNIMWVTRKRKDKNIEDEEM
ncbi:hypothetical protein L9F63_004331, partial [Diploptera punctata]